MKYFIRQLGQKDCAFACLKMLLAITHKNKDYLYYQQNDIDRSYSLEEIIKLALGLADKAFLRFSDFNLSSCNASSSSLKSMPY